MAQFNSAENVNVSDESIHAEQAKTFQFDSTVVESTDVMTGDRNRSRFLYYQLKMSLMKAKRVDIIVSFLMESGVRMILSDLRTEASK